MRAIIFSVTLLLAITFSSCGVSCSCRMYCIEYDKDSVKVCMVSLNDPNFGRSTDSLTALYGPATDTIQTGWEQTKGSIPATVIRNADRMEGQGYYCECYK